MSKRAVVVDDHTGIAQMASRALQEHLSVEIIPPISNFDEALTVLPALKPDLVVLDNRLVGGRGIDLLPPLTWRLPQTERLLYSGYLSPRILMEAVALGLDGAVSKQAPANVLIEAATQLLAGHGFFCEAASRCLRQPPIFKNFTPTERRILEQIVSGYEAKEIAAILGLCHKTVLNDLVVLRRKTGTQSMVDLAEFAKAHGLASHGLASLR